MRVETERMYLYPLSDEEMRLVIEKESDPEMKQAYTEMLEGSLSNPDKRIWYAIWNMELKDDPEIIAGDFCFKGIGDDGVIEIGYGLKEEYRHHGYMTEFPIYNYGELNIDETSRKLSLEDKTVNLTRTEFAILKLLIQNPGQVIANAF